MRKYSLSGAVLVSALLLAGAITSAVAQIPAGPMQPPMGGGMMTNMPMMPMIKYYDGYVYTLSGMLLCRYDATTLEQKGQVMLEEPTPTMMAAPAPITDGTTAPPPPPKAPMMHRMPPVFYINQDTAIVIGDHNFYRVLLKEMRVTQFAMLPDAAMMPEGMTTPPGMMMPDMAMNPPMREGNPPMREGNPGMREGNPGMHDGNPGMREGNLGVREGNPGMHEGNPGMCDGNHGMREGNPPMREGNPGMREGNPGMCDGNHGMGMKDRMPMKDGMGMGMKDGMGMMGGMNMMHMMMAPPTFVINDEMVYLVRGMKLLAINAVTGKITGQADIKSGNNMMMTTRAATVVKISAKQYAFYPKNITLKKGVPVTLEFTSLDVPHGFNCPGLGIRTDINPDRMAYITFTPDIAGNHAFRCDVMCGPGHKDMTGTITVTE